MVRQFIDAPLIVASASNGPSEIRAGFERPLWVLAAVVGLVMLIACSNVANLLTKPVPRRETVRWRCVSRLAPDVCGWHSSFWLKRSDGVARLCARRGVRVCRRASDRRHAGSGS
jgi:hypothetical protein